MAVRTAPAVCAACARPAPPSVKEPEHPAAAKTAVAASPPLQLVLRGGGFDRSGRRRWWRRSGCPRPNAPGGSSSSTRPSSNLKALTNGGDAAPRLGDKIGRDTAIVSNELDLTAAGTREWGTEAAEVETSKKTLILHGTKTSAVLNSVLSDIYHLKRDNAVKYTKKNDNIRPFESGGESSLEFFSLKTDCSLIVYGSHSKKRPNNLILGRTYDHHIYDLVEVGVENYKSMESYVYDKKLAPKLGSKPFFAFIGEHFESAEELKHLKEVLLDLFRGEVVENLNLAGVDQIYVCTAISPTTVYMMHCALRLKRSGTSIPRMELVEVGPSMDLVVRRHRLPVESLKKEAMKTAEHAKKMKNVIKDPVQGKLGKVYMPDQQVGKLTLSNDIKGLKRERREAKKNKEGSKKQKVNPE
ncbi:unnamed protein product [Miscanthus lutarioriparius]|uniref:Ribosome production factor 2 homolog n=1 Tax=Miscanthus lutarioriparius TaxID=422564 RepID=A0A811RWV0_9POAL|nr:unnamed protein product [Miscanthus lutarioriparius]